MFVETEIARKVSVLSILSANYEEKRKSLGPKNEKEPKDTLFLVHTCCLCLGFMNIMPLLFFNTAAGYWMYKFRDPAFGDTTAGANRTSLQTYYQPSSIAGSILPTIIFTSLLNFYGHKWAAMSRLIWSFIFMFGLFIVFTLFTNIDTDSWQGGFFVLTIFLIVVNSAFTATIQMSSAVIIAKLPQEYMFYYLLGQNGTFITTTIQIISLSVTDFQPTSGLIYFLCGAAIIAITILLLVLSRKSMIFKYYDVEDANDLKSEMVNWDESKEVLKGIWPCMVILGIGILVTACVHPSITTLVVSENEASKTPWTVKYFTPVGNFLVMEIGSLIGRVASKNLIITKSNRWWLIGFSILRLLICVPFYLFCNAQTRTLPVYFDKDWEFITFNFFFGLSIGMLLNTSFMSIKSLSGNKQEVALKLLMLSFSTFAAVTVVVGILMVKLLNI